MKKASRFKRIAALALLLPLTLPAGALAASPALSGYTPDTFVPALNERLEEMDLPEKVDATDPYVGDGGEQGYWVCENTYLMLTPEEDGNGLQRVTLTLLAPEDTGKALSLVESTIGATGQPPEEVAEALDASGLMAREEAKETASYHSDDGLHYMLETLSDGFLLCIEAE